MILIASGHSGLNGFIEETYVSQGRVLVLEHWSSVLEALAQATKIFIGEELTGLPSDWYDVARTNFSVSWVFWTEKQTDGTLPYNVSSWIGEITPDELERWLKTPSETLEIPAQWALWTPFPMDRLPVLHYFTERAQQAWGKGLWIDLDGHQAIWTVNSCPDLIEREHYPFSAMKSIPRAWGAIIPHAPAWVPQRDSDEGGIALQESWKNPKNKWIGVDLGGSLSGVWHSAVMRNVTHLMIVISPSTPLVALVTGLKVFKELNPAIIFMGIIPDYPPPWIGKNLPWDLRWHSTAKDLSGGAKPERSLWENFGSKIVDYIQHDKRGR